MAIMLPLAVSMKAEFPRPANDCWTTIFTCRSAELVVYGRDTLQHDSRLPMIYSESSGLAMFLMQSGGGRYRQPLIEYFKRYTRTNRSRGTLAKLTGASYEKADRQYADFLKQAPAGN